MKIMITIIPIPIHDAGEISLEIIEPVRIKKIEEIRDNENALNFRTWYVEVGSGEQEKNVSFKLLNNHAGEKPVFIDRSVDITGSISVEEFKEKEITRICQARDGEIETICKDVEELNKYLERNNLTKGNIINTIEVIVP